MLKYKKINIILIRIFGGGWSKVYVYYIICITAQAIYQKFSDSNKNGLIFHFRKLICVYMFRVTM